MTQYIEITGLIVPDTAQEGEQVSVQVNIKNLWTTQIYVVPTGVVDSAELFFGNLGQWLNPGETAGWSQSFTMINRSVLLSIAAWYWTTSGWIKGDEATKSIELEGVVPEGKIEVVQFTIPDNAKAGETMEIKVKVKNTFSDTKNVKIEGVMNTTSLEFTPSSYILSSGMEKEFISSFIMPSQDALVSAWSYYIYDNDWYPSDSGLGRVSLVVEGPPSVINITEILPMIIMVMGVGMVVNIMEK